MASWLVLLQRVLRHDLRVCRRISSATRSTACATIDSIHRSPIEPGARRRRQAPHEDHPDDPERGLVRLNHGARPRPPPPRAPHPGLDPGGGRGHVLCTDTLEDGMELELDQVVLHTVRTPAHQPAPGCLVVVDRADAEASHRSSLTAEPLLHQRRRRGQISHPQRREGAEGLPAARSADCSSLPHEVVQRSSPGMSQTRSTAEGMTKRGRPRSASSAASIVRSRSPMSSTSSRTPRPLLRSRRT